MDVIQKITQTIGPSLEAMGYTLVLLKFNEGAKRRTLSVMCERADGVGMSFDDCTEISHAASALLDVEDPITGAYDLEVCSPGLDRPLTRREDFTRYRGFEAKLETMLPVDGRKRFRGVVEGMEGDAVVLTMPEGAVRVPFGQVRNAKLVMTEALVKDAMKKGKK